MKKNQKFLLPLLICLGHFSLSSVCLGYAAEIKISSSISPYEEVFVPSLKEIETATGVQIKFKGNSKILSAIEIFRDVIQGSVDAGSAAVGIEDWKKLLIDQSTGEFSTDSIGSLKSFIIGEDLLKITANKGVGITELTQVQLKDIFTGKIKNWKELGGTDTPITLVTMSNNPGTVAVFKKIILNGEAFGKNMRTVYAVPELVTVLTQTPGTISFCSGSTPEGSLRVLKTPRIVRPITLITKGDPSENVKKVIQFFEKKKPH